MGEVTRVGVDLAQRVVQVHAVDATGRVIVAKQLQRRLHGVVCAAATWLCCSHGSVHRVASLPRTHLFESEYARVAARSIDAGSVLTQALAAAPPLTTPFPSGNALADQLKFVARMISTAAATGTKRQVFFVSIGGFDTGTARA